MLIALVGQEVISSLCTKLLASCNVLLHTVLFFSDPALLMVHFQQPNFIVFGTGSQVTNDQNQGAAQKKY